jgi:aspartyl-tRNA(Asn)/glutamyl-tRNA(Gln) amidotransferase subunit A
MAASEAARAIAARELSPVELMQALLERIGRLDPKLHVFIRLDGDAAMDAAKAAEAEIALGRLRGPLHGVPVGIKDIIDVAGLPTTCHSKLLIDNVASADALCVSRLRGAGAVVLGKLSTHEFAIGGPSFDLPWPIVSIQIEKPVGKPHPMLREPSSSLTLCWRGWRDMDLNPRSP